MTKPAAVSCLVALLVFVGSITGASIFDLLDYQKAVASSALPRTNGALFCNGGNAEFRLPDFDIFQYAIKNPYSPGLTRVESVQIGLRSKGIPDCLASRFPTNTNNPLLQKSHVIVLNYTQCGWQAEENNETITYKNTAVATLLYPPPPGTTGVVSRKIFHIPMTCAGASVVPTRVTAKFFQSITQLTGVGSEFDVTFAATSRRELREEFGENLDTNIIILTIGLDRQYRDMYSMVGNKCWATSTSDAASTPRYEFLKSRGFNAMGEEFLVVNQTSDEVVYEIADFEFDGVEAEYLFFFCEINICLKLDASRCIAVENPEFTEPQLNRLAAVQNTASDRLLSSAPEKRSSTPARVRVDSHGRPSKIEL